MTFVFFNITYEFTSLNNRGPGVVIHPSIVSGMVAAPVSYWSIFFCPFQQSKKSSRKLTWPSFVPVSKVASNRSLLDSMNFMTRLNKDLSSYELRRMPSHVLYHRVPCPLFMDNSSIESGLWFFLQLDPNTLQDTCRYQYATAVGTKVISRKVVGMIEFVYP